MLTNKTFLKIISGVDTNNEILSVEIITLFRSNFTFSLTDLTYFVFLKSNLWISN